MLEDLARRLPSDTLVTLGKAAWRERGTILRRVRSAFRRRPATLVFVPDSAGLSTIEVVERKLFVRLILIGSASWTRGRTVVMKPNFTATILPPGNGSYYFTGAHCFETAPVPRGLHAYFIGQQPLRTEHQDIDPFTHPGVIFDGNIDVEGLGAIPIFPLNVSSGAFAEGGGHVNEPIELRA